MSLFLSAGSRKAIFYAACVFLVAFGVGVFLIFGPEGGQEPPVPRPHGYFRIDFPEKSYLTFAGRCPFVFEYPEYVRIVPAGQPCWLTLEDSVYHAQIHLTYKTLQGNPAPFIADSRRMVYQTIALRADAVDEYPFAFPEKRIYGLVYQIQGDAASPLQFYATDSIRHFLLGSLYFTLPPDQDSLAPAIRYFTEDVWHLIRTLNWTEGKVKKNM
jgi:gliding motility-associated lipoprotein GldD